MRNYPRIMLATAIVLFLIVGWCMNVYALATPFIGTAFGDVQITGVMVLRAVGIILWPLGVLMGFLSF